MATLPHGVLSEGGMDQGVHQIVVREHRAPGLRIKVLTNERGPIFHNVCWDSQVKDLEASALHDTYPFGRLMNGHRTQIAALVHQYDRCASLMKRMPFFDSSRATYELRSGGASAVGLKLRCQTWLKVERWRSGIRYYQQPKGTCLTQVPELFTADEHERCLVRYATLADATSNCTKHRWCSGVVRDGGLPCSGLHSSRR